MTAPVAADLVPVEDLRRLGLGAGLDAVGVTGVEPFDSTRRQLERHRVDGRHGGMAFTYRNPARSTDPRRLLGGARSLVVGARGYLEPRPPRPDGPTARVARYAWRDHYADLRSGLEVIADDLRHRGHRAVVVADANGLVDRAAAHRAGLGWWGRNTNMLLPGLGSWFVIGSVVTTAPVSSGADAVPAPMAQGCGSCSRCLPACPTGALVAGGVLDARRCLAWLVQAPGVFPRAHRVALGDRLYGCDDCQEACPPGVASVRSSGADQPVSLRSGPAALDGDAWVDVGNLLAADDDELMSRFGRWYVPERDPRYLRRNALVVLGNVGSAADREQRATVERVLGAGDELLRAHAVWTAARLGWHDLLGPLAADPSPLVRSELALAPTVPALGR